MVRSTFGFVAGFALLVSACGGDSDSETFQTSVGSTKTVDKLTPAETAQFCKDGDAFAKDFEKTFTPKLCKVAGLLATTKAECDMLVNACLKEESEPDQSSGMCEPLTDCTATVGEVQKCLNDTIATFSAYLDKFPSCAQIADKSGTFPASEPVSPASCKAIEKTCPDVADFGSSVGDN